MSSDTEWNVSCIRHIVPAWKSRLSGNDANRPYHVADYGNMGVIFESDSSADGNFDINLVKNNSISCLGAKICALPFLPPNPEGHVRQLAVQQKRFAENVHNGQWQQSVNTYKTQIEKSPHLKDELNRVLSTLLKNDNVEVEVPQFVYKLAKQIPNQESPEVKAIEELIEWHGCGIAFQSMRSSNDKLGSFLHASGKSLDTLGS